MINGDIVKNDAPIEEEKRRFDMVLLEKYPQYTRGTIQKFIKEGLASINGEAVLKANYLLSADEEEHCDIAVPDNSNKERPPVIYEDDNVIVFNKPAGMLSIKKGAYLDETAIEDFGEIVHRLDRDTSGVIIVAKNAETKSRIVILLSDGVSNTGAVEPDDAAAAAAKLGIRVYTIGVGTHSSRTPFRARDVFGRTTVQYANMSFDESQLKSIAKKTNARYFGVRDAKGLKAALDEIDQLEKTTLDRTVFQRYREYFPPFLFAGALLVLAAVSLQMAASRRLV